MITATELRETLLAETNVLLYGPPATGKTHLVQELVGLLQGTSSEMEQIHLDTSKEAGYLQQAPVGSFKVFWVTFHQTYSYEDFVIGLRPDLDASSPLKLKPEPGILLSAAAHAAIPGNSSLIVIDEINRGNVSRVLGEFITLMEAEKRLLDDGQPSPTTVSVRLPYLKDGDTIALSPGQTVSNPFSMPTRLYTLATMNSVDRSAAPLDAAIRRRFRVIDLFPDRALLASAVGLASVEPAQDIDLTSVEGIKALAVSLLDAVNARIQWFLGRDYQLGQWYLSGLKNATSLHEAKAALAGAWSGRIWPQLEDTFALHPEQLALVVGLKEGLDTGALTLAKLPEDAIELGGVPAPVMGATASDDEVVEVLRGLVKRLTAD